MSDETRRRLFGYQHAFDDPVTVVLVSAIVALLVVAGAAIAIVILSGRVSETRRKDLSQRYFTWLVIIPCLVVPILLGAAWTIGMVFVLGLACFREFARATGLFRERLVTGIVAMTMILMTFAIADHWYNFFTALVPLSICLIAAAGVVLDRPQGYIQRVALGIFAFMLFATCLGHLGYIANDARYRSHLLTIFVVVELNDIFAYVVGSTMGRRPLASQTSPNKTREGAIGGIVLTTGVFALIGSQLYEGTVLANWYHLVGLGVILGIAGLLGDLMLSAIKRDIGVKDLGVTLPGHGGLLDRFDSLILAAPAYFHYVGYFLGFGWDQQTRVLSGGW